MSPTAASPLPLEEELRQEAADIDAVETTAQTNANFSPSTSDSNNESVSLQQQIVISPITGILLQLQTDDLLNFASDFAAFTNFYFAYKHRFCGFRLNAFWQFLFFTGSKNLWRGVLELEYEIISRKFSLRKASF